MNSLPSSPAPSPARRKYTLINRRPRSVFHTKRIRKFTSRRSIENARRVRCCRLVHMSELSFSDVEACRHFFYHILKSRSDRASWTIEFLRGISNAGVGSQNCCRSCSSKLTLLLRMSVFRISCPCLLFMGDYYARLPGELY